MILSPSIRRTAQRRGVHLSRLDPDANVPTDARRNNGAPRPRCRLRLPVLQALRIPATSRPPDERGDVLDHRDRV